MFIRILKLLGAIIAASALVACSAIKLAYNQAPELGYWWLDGYVDFNGAQSPKVRNELAKLHTWHRTQELPKIADFLSRQASVLPQDISAAQACAGFSEVRQYVDTAVDQALPGLAEFALTITPEQIAHLKGKYSKVNAEFERDYIRSSPAEQKAKRLKQAIERSEMIYGKLEQAQRSVLEGIITASSFDPPLSLKESQRRQQDLMAVLTELSQKPSSSDAAQTALRAYLQRSLSSPNLTYRSYAERLTQEACQSFATVHASATAAQRTQAVNTLKAWAADARLLASTR